MTATLKKEIVTLERGIEGLHKRLDLRRDHIASLAKDFDSMVKMDDALKKKYAILRNKFDALTGRADNLKEENDDLLEKNNREKQHPESGG
jgi:cell division protein FtsB